MQYCTIEDPATRRNRQNYNEDVLKPNFTETGIHHYSTFNSIPYFHVTESSVEDLTHSVEEGIIKYNISDALWILIYEDHLFTLQELNRRLKEFSYGEEEKSNKPHLILKDHLDNNKLKMSASETANFLQNITFILGDLIPQDNAVWSLILSTVKFFDFSYLPCYEEEDLEEWRKNIDEMSCLYMQICKTHLKPHHHYSIHFPVDTTKFGPLRYLRTIR